VKPGLGRIALRALAGLYLAGLWMDGIGCNVPGHVLPRSFNLFLSVAALFTEADHYILEYRAEAWVCDERRWRELDPRPYFPIDVDNKESRFQRAMYMHHKDARTMRALDAFLVDHHNHHAGADGIGKDLPIGGVRLLALRIPFPAVGEPVPRYGWRPLEEYPKDVRHAWYRTGDTVIQQRCGGGPPKDDATPAPRENPAPLPDGDTAGKEGT